MRLLLDTHVWLWGLLEPARLSRGLADKIRKARELWLSPISVWEFLILAEKGRVRIDASPDAWLEAAFAQTPVKEAPLTTDIVRASRGVLLPHPDPADRFIAATAQVLGHTLVTADERLLRLKGLSTLSAR